MPTDIKQVVKQGVFTAFQHLSSLVEPITLKQPKTGTYNPSTGVTTNSNAGFPLEGIFVDFELGDGRYKNAEISQDAIEIGDKNLLLKAADIVNSPIELRNGDTVTQTSGGAVYTIFNIKIDPTNSLYEIHLRGTK